METRQGNILAATDLEAIVNPVNCAGVMGKGLALQFARRYPQITRPYQTACRQSALTPDKPQIIELSQDELPRYIVNLATKVRWQDPSRISWIDAGLSAMYQQLLDRNVTTVGLPALGTGLGQLPFTEVRELIAEHTQRNPDVRTVLYLPTA